MPSSQTFSIAPIADLLERRLAGCDVVVDPFSRNSRIATHRNDLDPSTEAETNLPAEDFCLELLEAGVVADAVLFDPPYSPRQISEVYKRVGLNVGMAETQNGRLYRAVKDGLDKLLKPGGLSVCCGWNSSGMGLTRGYEPVEMLVVAHGGAHNDTLVIVERKTF